MTSFLRPISGIYLYRDKSQIPAPYQQLESVFQQWIQETLIKRGLQNAHRGRGNCMGFRRSWTLNTATMCKGYKGQEDVRQATVSKIWVPSWTTYISYAFWHVTKCPIQGWIQKPLLSKNEMVLTTINTFLLYFLLCKWLALLSSEMCRNFLNIALLQS